MSQARSTSPRGARSDTGIVRSNRIALRARSSSISFRTTMRRSADTHSNTNRPGATTSTSAAIHERHSDLARALSSSTTRSLSARLASRQINLPGMPLLPHLAQGLDGRPLRPRPTPLRFLHALDPAQHLALEVRRLRVASLEALEILHADQRGLGPTSGREHDPLTTVGGIVDEGREVIARVGEAYVLHGSLLNTPKTPQTPDASEARPPGHGPELFPAIPARGTHRESCRPEWPRSWSGAWPAPRDVHPSSAALS